MHPSRVAATLLAPMALGRVPEGEGGPAPKAVGEWCWWRAGSHRGCLLCSLVGVQGCVLRVQRDDWLQHHGAHAAHGQVSEQEQSPWDASPAGGDWCGLSWGMGKKRRVSETDFLSHPKKDLTPLTSGPCLLCLESTNCRLDVFAHKASPGRAGCCKIRSLI